MISIVNELKQATKNNLWAIALNMALLLPEICTKLESLDGKSNGKKYISWFDTYCTPRFNGTLGGTDIYATRCNSIDHTPQRSGFDKIVFQLPGEGTIHNRVIDSKLIINLAVFADIVVEGYESWWAEHRENLLVRRNLSDKQCTLKFEDYFEWNY